MFEFVCVIYFNNLQNQQYIGSFESCAGCNSHVHEFFKEEKVEWVKCLHEDYIVLPKGFIKKEVRYD